MLTFMVYVLYTQVHSFVKSLGAVVFGTTTTLACTRPLMDALQVKLLRATNSNSLARGRVMYLCNHRSWADFVVDSVLTNGGSYLARYGVFFGVPMSCLFGWVSGSVFFFHRRKGVDRSWFAKFIDEMWNYRPTTGLIVYPEGTRNLKQDSLPLKTGCLEAAYKLQVPVQVIITTNKEDMVNERKLTIHVGSEMTVMYSHVLNPKDYENLKDWYTAVQNLWDETWQAAHACTEPVPFRGADLDVLLKAAPEPAVMHRVWAIRTAVFLTVAAAVAVRTLRSR